MFTTITEHDLQCIIENNSLPFITGIHICMYLAYTFFIEKILDVDELSINTQTFCSWQFSCNKHLISFYRNLSQTLTCWNGMLVHHHHLTNRTLLHEICPGEEKTNIPCWCLHQIRTREPHFSSCPSLFWMKTRLSPLNLRQKQSNLSSRIYKFEFKHWISVRTSGSRGEKGFMTPITFFLVFNKHNYLSFHRTGPSFTANLNLLYRYDD